MTPLERILKRVSCLGDLDDPATPRPLLTLEEFFEGNDVLGSIGCNLIPTPTPAEFYEVLKGMRARDGVADVRVQVTEIDTPEWPFSDVVWIITRATAIDVAAWFDDAIRPDECSVGWFARVPTEPCPVPTGMQPIRCWWD
jgi:hypothetical protein